MKIFYKKKLLSKNNLRSKKTVESRLLSDVTLNPVAVQSNIENESQPTNPTYCSLTNHLQC